MRVLELYSGIGGMHCALRESSVKGEIIAAVDINTVANTVYKHNFPNTYLINRNVQSLSINEINKLNIDTILMSPPCQPFTRTGLQKDILDNRSGSLFYVLSWIPQIKTLKYILLENVKGFEKSDMRCQILQTIKAADFEYKELILSPCQFGIPNTRYRYYLLAKKREIGFCFDNSTLDFNLPETVLKELSKIKLTSLAEDLCTSGTGAPKNCYTLANILEDVQGSQYLIPKNVLQKRAWLLDIRTSKSNGSCCFTKAYSHYAEGTGSIYCPLSDEILKDTFLEVKKYEKQSPEVSEILGKLKLRYFTPREVCRLMCFPEEFTFPVDITCKQKYRLLGNSINVQVVSKLIFLLNNENKMT